MSTHEKCTEEYHIVAWQDLNTYTQDLQKHQQTTSHTHLVHCFTRSVYTTSSTLGTELHSPPLHSYDARKSKAAIVIAQGLQVLHSLCPLPFLSGGKNTMWEL